MPFCCLYKIVRVIPVLVQCRIHIFGCLLVYGEMVLDYNPNQYPCYPKIATRYPKNSPHVSSLLVTITLSMGFASMAIELLDSSFSLYLSLWLIRYFLKTYVYTPSIPCRDVKFCPNIPLGDLSWNSLTEVMWHHQINGFSNSKFWKDWQENVHVGLENDWSGSFVLLYGWNNEDVRWGFSLFKSIGKLWAV